MGRYASGKIREGGALWRWATVPHQDMFNLTYQVTVACRVSLEGDGDGDGMPYQQGCSRRGLGGKPVYIA